MYDLETRLDLARQERARRIRTGQQRMDARQIVIAEAAKWEPEHAPKARLPLLRKVFAR